MENPVFYASARDGLVLPIVDVRHPAFLLRLTEAELDALAEKYVNEVAGRQQQMTAELVEALKRSRLGRGLIAASNGFLGGIETYMMKAGPENLGPDVHPLDRAIAASFPALTTRLRMQETAELAAAGLSAPLAARPGCPIVFLNIGGGAGADSWNALLLLLSSRPALLIGREVLIVVVDVDDDGPAFGAAAIEALRQPGAPFQSVAVRFRQATYDWSSPGSLGPILSALPADAVCAVSAEGALFEYGSDQEIVDNLRELRTATPQAVVAVGTVTRDSAATRASRSSTRVATVPRTSEAFGELAAAAGWVLESSVARPFSYNVRLFPRQ